jgi:hypothetical protein
MDKQTIIDEERRKYYREYMREYRKKNKERIKEHTQRYWARRATFEARSLQSLEREILELKYRAL